MWVFVISFVGFIIYKGDKFSDWKGNGFIGGLFLKVLVCVVFNKGDEGNWKVEEVECYEWGKWVCEVE